MSLLIYIAIHSVDDCHYFLSHNCDFIEKLQFSWMHAEFSLVSDPLPYGRRGGPPSCDCNPDTGILTYSCHASVILWVIQFKPVAAV